MQIPLKYNLRNLRRRWRLTSATMLGIALVVAVFIMVMALANGLKVTYVSTGDPRNLLVLRKGSTAESSSQITRNDVRLIKYLDGIARDENGNPLASAEILVLINLKRRDQHGSANVLVRGIGPVGLKLRTKIQLVEGRMFQPGLNECIVSRRIARRFAGCGLGEQFRTGRTLWRVVGVFDAEKTAYESEIWVDADEARNVFKRNFYGSILIRPVEDTAVGAQMIRRMETDKQLSVRVLPETEYYREQTRTAVPIQWLGRVLAVVMSIGAAFFAMNTMYAAVASRTREIGTLRVLGFQPRQIYISFLMESVLLALFGGLLGCLFSLPINGLATGTMSWTTFSEVAFEFRVTPLLLLKGMFFAVVMGVLGGLLPARLAARKPVLEALRSV
ncbi:MAG: ABC transporter permease [Verrucomicrobiae bacterium]|nr:ABC transporter permease [Verrucomicrobiae bacterium]